MTGDVVHVLANPASGGHDDRDIDRLCARVSAYGGETVVLAGSTPEASLDAAVSAVEDGASRLVAVGGDGIVHLALQAVAGTDVVLGLLPQGTGNDFARDLGLLRHELDTAIDAALDDATPVDAIKTSHGWVATVATLGFAGDVTARANAMSWPRGQQRYTLATLAQLPKIDAVDLAVTVDGVTQGLRTTMLSVGNTAYFGGGMRICPGADPHDGRFEATSVGDVSKLTFLRVFPKVFKGRHVDHPDVLTMVGTTMSIESGDEVEVWGDGEHLGPLPIELEVVRDAVRVAGA